ncbi:MBL fold metallo-hydrolase [Pyxidicoccus xibeiensis]|uniref:MBL fold metallo-hydrolase n=1 Tax=Pyxidicoccus xibeiensis TaxID=2906759 RepID=UPI0020A7FD6B|nr:MBL fold metallo-hydrolase [Pyxidicoccus xibeiensis]MCP3137038.1 MBL fold metallo-hydrolase [Pyxidicoccus xibeiensis]
MGLMQVAPLEALTQLSREWLHVFVAGPGQGEGIAIALPERGWLLVDGCATSDGRFPLEVILQRWRSPTDDPVEAMVLTHPHEDHIEGVAELLEALAPEKVAVTAGDAPGSTLLKVALTLMRAAPAGNTHTQLLARKVIAALAAIEGWEALHPGGLVGLVDGQLLLSKSDVRVHVRAPDPAGLKELLRPEKLGHRLRAEANHLSLVLEVCFGDLRLVLTGDLPFLRGKGGAAVPTGWQAVSRRHPHLGVHQGLKVPHHGSTEAMHPGWMTPQKEPARAWLVTPYNSSRLPRLTQLEGLPRLLEHESEVLLTALPASKQLQADQQAGGRVRLGQVVERLAGQRRGTSFLDGATVISPGSAVEPLDPVWCVAFDQNGVIQGRWYGRAALAVTA